jgi:hypothetical protein
MCQNILDLYKQYKYNVTLKRVRANIVVVEKQ